MPYIHSPKDHLRGRKQVTVLFADIVRSSDIVRKFDSETAEDIFNQVIAQQIEITEKFEGTVNQVMGDGIMCLFGAEPPYEDHALRAVSAGKEMVRCALQMQKKRRNVSVKIRVGINTGEVMLARPGNAGYRATFQVTGEVVHVTDRVLKQARPNRMLVSESSRSFLERYYRFRKAGILNWRPDAAPLNLYEPTALKPAAPLHSAPLRKKYTPRAVFENRIAALISAAQTKKEPAIIWVHGDPGVGKTNLVNHVVRKRCKNKFDVFLQVNFYPDPISGGNPSFERAVVEALHGKAGRRPSPAEKSKFPFFEDCLRDILHAGDTGAAYAALDVSARMTLKAGLVAHLLLAFAEKKNVLLLLEDMQWAKEDSLLYIERLIQAYGGHERLLIVATSRRGHPFDKDQAGKKIREVLLDPMTPREGVQFLQKLDARKQLSRPLKNKIYVLSGGNPYFIGEYFRWAQAGISGGLAGREVKSGLDQYTPGRVADILYNRLAALGGEFVRIAKIAAVLGMRVNLDVLQAVCGHERKLLLSLLERLEEADVLKKDRIFPVPEWVFTHELLQKVAYHSIPHSVRARWHRAVIQQLKKIRFANIDGRHFVMAVHADKSGDALLKYVYSKWAAREENARSRHQSSIDLSVASRQALAAVPGVKRREKHDIAARLFEISNLFIVGKHSRAARHVDELLKRKAALKKFGYLERALSFKELCLWIRGDLPGAAKIAKTILSLDVGDRRHEVHIRENSRLGNIHIDMGRYKEAVVHDLRVVRAIPDGDFANKFHLLVQAKPASLASLALTYSLLGDAGKSREYFDRACGFLEKSDDYFTRIFILLYLAHSLIVRGKNHEALGLLKTALESCDKSGASLLRPYAMAVYGIALVRTGKPREGLRFCKEALAATARNKLVLCAPQFEIWHAEALEAQGGRSAAVRKEPVYTRL